MNILQIISGGETGGSKTHILNVCQYFKKKHINAILVCLIDGKLYQDALILGIDAILVEQKSRFNLDVVNKIGNIISKNKIDIVHSHGGRANFICHYLKKRYSIPFVTTIHSDYLQDYMGNVFKSIVFSHINKYVLKRFDSYIAISDEFKKMLVDRGFNKDKISVVYNGIDFDRQLQFLDKKELCTKYGIDVKENDKIISIVARLHPIKGHTVFIDSCRLVLKKYDNIKIIIAGDGALRTELVNYVRELGLNKYIYFIGEVNSSYDILYNSYVSVLASYSESFPFVLLESAFTKTPVIASNVGGINKLIIEGETGYIFKPGDSTLLAAKIEKILNDENLRNALGTNLYKYASDNYSLEAMCLEIIDIYSKLIKHT